MIVSDKKSRMLETRNGTHSSCPRVCFQRGFVSCSSWFLVCCRDVSYSDKESCTLTTDVLRLAAHALQQNWTEFGDFVQIQSKSANFETVTSRIPARMSPLPA
jgi:hypothetical protein